MVTADFILASASPRRAELLRQIGARFLCCPADVDETPIPGEAPRDYVLRLALTKAGAVLAMNNPDADSLPVLAADTTVAIDGQLLGKPENEEQAVAMLMSLSGRSHRVFTAVAVVSSERSVWRITDTSVTFAALDEQQCRRYWQTGEPRDKAGAYAIQGLGAVFVEKIAGSYSGVVGLPLAETRELLALFGVSCWHRDGH
ncbi:MAG: nucleoside triphosphate pyrophosphatase [Porticoccaceae bacterium]|jgi:septum formation protein